MSEKESKTKELERLLSEKKITLDQYLDVRIKIESTLNDHSGERLRENCKEQTESSNIPLSSPKVIDKETRKSENHSFHTTDIAIALSPLFILVGAGLMWSETSSVQTRGLIVYPYFYQGISLSALGMLLLLGGLTRHLHLKRTRGSAYLILLGGVGIFLTFIGAVILWQAFQVVNEINSLAYTIYYVSVPPWTQGLFGLIMLAGGIFMLVVGPIRSRSNVLT